MTEASSFFFVFSFFFFTTNSEHYFFHLILNKYIFTFLCYIHYVNILKPNVTKRTLYLLIVVRKEGLSFSIEWLLHKK